MIKTGADIERSIANISAIMSFENMELTEQDKDNIRRVLTGEATGNEVVAEVIKDYVERGIINGSTDKGRENKKN